MNESSPSHRHTPMPGAPGFTLLEIVVVLVAIGIISTAALVRLPDTITMNTRSELDTLRSHVHYAQQRALTRHDIWGIEFLDGSTYWLYYIDDSGFRVGVILPGAASMNAVYNPDSMLESINNQNLQINTNSLPSSSLIGASGSPPLPQAVAKIEFDPNGSPGRSDIVVRSSDGTTLFTIIAYTGVIQ